MSLSNRLILEALEPRVLLSANPVSIWTFDTDATDSVGTNDGTLTNGAAIVIDAQRAGVVELDGTDDHITIPSSKDINRLIVWTAW